ncbi:hypothetical protein L6V77_19755 [Myxococcota bacterium]|nr:hypothetical protein [Myxococcota bacterium]
MQRPGRRLRRRDRRGCALSGGGGASRPRDALDVAPDRPADGRRPVRGRDRDRLDPPGPPRVRAVRCGPQRHRPAAHRSGPGSRRAQRGLERGRHRRGVSLHRGHDLGPVRRGLPLWRAARRSARDRRARGQRPTDHVHRRGGATRAICRQGQRARVPESQHLVHHRRSRGSGGHGAPDDDLRRQRLELAALLRRRRVHRGRERARM